MYRPAIVLFTVLSSFGLLILSIVGIWVLWAQRHERSCKKYNHPHCRWISSSSAIDGTLHKDVNPVIDLSTSKDFCDECVLIPLPLKIKKAPQVIQ